MQANGGRTAKKQRVTQQQRERHLPQTAAAATVAATAAAAAAAFTAATAGTRTDGRARKWTEGQQRMQGVWRAVASWPAE